MVLGSSKPLSDNGTEARRGPLEPVRHALDPLQHPRREGHVSRLRSRRKPRIPIDELKPGRNFGIPATVMAWVVLAVGIGIAVIGAVQAVRTAPDKPAAAATVETENLSRQIEQLKVELDRERQEKQNLLEKLAAAQSQAAAVTASSTEASTPPERPAVMVPAEESTSSTLPAQTQIQDGGEVVASVPQVQPQPLPQAPAATSPPSEQGLPAPMAPSAELLTPAGPAVADAEAAQAGGPASFAVHLASFADRVMAERGWVLLQRNHPAALGDLSPRIEAAEDDAGKPIFLLLAGPFQTRELAAAHCKSIRSQVVFCKPRPFVGDALTAVQ
jgi:hypothetical protein